MCFYVSRSSTIASGLHLSSESSSVHARCVRVTRCALHVIVTLRRLFSSRRAAPTLPPNAAHIHQYNFGHGTTGSVAYDCITFSRQQSIEEQLNPVAHALVLGHLARYHLERHSRTHRCFFLLLSTSVRHPRTLIYTSFMFQRRRQYFTVGRKKKVCLREKWNRGSNVQTLGGLWYIELKKSSNGISYAPGLLSLTVHVLRVPQQDPSNLCRVHRDRRKKTRDKRREASLVVRRRRIATEDHETVALSLRRNLNLPYTREIYVLSWWRVI